MTDPKDKPRFDDIPEATREFRKALFEKVDDLHDIMQDFAGQCKGRHESINRDISDLRQGRRENAQAVVAVKAEVQEDKRILAGLAKFLGSNKAVILAVIMSFVGTGVWGHFERQQNMGKIDETAKQVAHDAATAVTDNKVHGVTLDRDNADIIGMLKALDRKLADHMDGARASEPHTPAVTIPPTLPTKDNLYWDKEPNQ